MNKIILTIISALITKIISDPRKINIQIYDFVLKKKIEINLLKFKTLNKNNIKIIVYNKNVLILGQTNTLENSYILKNKIKNIINNNNIKIFNFIKTKKKFLKNYIQDKIIFTKLILFLIRFNILKLNLIKIIVENNEIFIIGYSKKSNCIKLIKLIKFIFNNIKIVLAVKHYI